MTKLKLVERSTSAGTVRQNYNWRILVVDDDPAIHTVTHLALRNLHFQGRGLDILVAESAAEAREILAREDNIAIVLLDVVMETENAGLELVSYIRDELNNANIRIILRTGQPGQAPEEEVIVRYDINDYKAKTELTVQKLFSTTVTALRTYEHLRFLDIQRRGLQQILEASDTLYEEQSLQRFATGVLSQLCSLLGTGANGILCLQLTGDGEQIQVLAATEHYQSAAQLDWLSLPIDDEARELILSVFRSQENRYGPNHTLLYISQGKDPSIVAYMNSAPPDEPVRSLIELFCRKLSASFRNLYLYQQMREANALLSKKLAEVNRQLAERE